MKLLYRKHFLVLQPWHSNFLRDYQIPYLILSYFMMFILLLQFLFKTRPLPLVGSARSVTNDVSQSETRRTSLTLLDKYGYQAVSNMTHSTLRYRSEHRPTPVFVWLSSFLWFTSRTSCVLLSSLSLYTWLWRLFGLLLKVNSCYATVSLSLLTVWY